MKILSIIVTAGVYFCVATVISQAIGVAVLWKNGSLNKEKLHHLVALVQDVDIHSIQKEVEDANKPKDVEQLAFKQVLDRRADKDLNLHLRESSIEKALGELRQLQSQLQGEWTRYNQLTDAFQKELQVRQDDYVVLGRLDVRQIFESAKPKQAKDQIIEILKEDTSQGSPAMADVVRFIKSMPRDKSKKIISEFKTEEEKDLLHEILRQIRLGEPEVSLIKKTREKLPKE